MSWLHHILAVALFLLSLTQAEYFITTTPAKVEVGITEGLTMECRFRGDPSSSALSSISRVRILKDMSQDDFQIVAEARDFETEAHNLGLGPNVNVTGFVGQLSSSYLSIYWDLVTSSVLGRYRCDIVGFKANQDIYTEKTPVFILKESNVTFQDVIDLTIRQKSDLELQLQAQKAYCDSRIATIEAGIDTKIGVFKIDQENASKVFEDQLLKHIAGLEADVARLMETGVLQYWPEGTYGLLEPDSGCPNKVGAQWNISSRKFHTESTDRNYDEISTSSHLMSPTLVRANGNNFVYQHFCISTVVSPGASWPKGAYCINRVGGVCPSGFSTGSITWQDEVEGPNAETDGILPDGTYTRNSTHIFYCCRNDGQHDDPIYLPKSRPFYLYRYNGTCQEVVGMQTFSEYMVFDTDNSNHDAYDNIFHPDGSINNVRIELCYYLEK